MMFEQQQKFSIICKRILGLELAYINIAALFKSIVHVFSVGEYALFLSISVIVAIHNLVK